MIPEISQMNVGRDNEVGEEQKLIVDENSSISIKQVAGVVDSEEVSRLRKLIFRVTKGKSYIYTQQIEQPEGDENLARQVDTLIEQTAKSWQKNKPKSVYIIIYWSGVHIRDKLVRICESFTGSRFEIPHYGQIHAEIE